MALLIEKTVNLLGGVPVDQLYLRLEYSVDRFGKTIDCEVFPYLNREKYIEDKGTIQVDKGKNVLNVDKINKFYTFNYIPEISGTNILEVVHDNLKSVLTTDVTQKRPLRDPSTGEIIIDPSTGGALTEDVILVNKFAEPGEISIVDISIG
jgi:hypothetical protein